MSRDIKQLNKFSHISERDVDLLLLEELSVSDDFFHFFITRLGYPPSDTKKQGAWHSLNVASLGESDLVLLFENNNESIGVLIENKIDAPETENQAARYSKRGDLGIENKSWSFYITCMVAPESYLHSKNAESVYDKEISYEEIMHYFAQKSSIDKRCAYKFELLGNAVQQQRRGYERVVHNALSEYVSEYMAFANEKYAQLSVEEFKERSPEHDWVYFYPFGDVKSPKIVHQIRAGSVKIFLKDRADDFNEIYEKYSNLPDIDLKVSITKAGTITIGKTVSSVDGKRQKFCDTQNVIESALVKIDKLITHVKAIEIIKNDLPSNAVKQHRPVYERIVHNALSDYVREYIAFANKKYPELSVEEYKDRAPAHDWVYFNPFGNIPSPKFVHQIRGGAIKIFIKGRADEFNEINEKYSTLPDIDLEVSITKAGTITIGTAVPSVDGKVQEFRETQNVIEIALSKIAKLASHVRTIENV